jgi:hypothetical protein
MQYVTDIRDGTSVEWTTNKEMENKIKVHLTATWRQNVTYGTDDLASCKLQNWVQVVMVFQVYYAAYSLLYNLSYP